MQSIYIHIPFCSRKCLFCSFAIAVGQEHRREEYVNALIAEMKSLKRKGIKTIYLGGGTPSLLDEKDLDQLMNAITKNFSIVDDAEITIECNPESVTRSKAKFLKQLGFNRISLGAQSTNERYLKFLGRNHDAPMIKNAVLCLRECGFANINVDLMYAFPGQTPEELTQDVRNITALGSEHISLYTLTIEPNSRFYAIQTKLDDDQKLAEHFLLVKKLLAEAGLEQYEISNFAKKGFESKHNQNYWLGGSYHGLGMAAHGFDGSRRYWNTASLQEYLKRVSLNQSTIDGFEDLSDYQIQMEKVLFGLRMNRGIHVDLLPLSKCDQINAWIKDGFLTLEGDILKATDQGQLVLDELSSRLI